MESKWSLWLGRLFFGAFGVSLVVKFLVMLGDKQVATSAWVTMIVLTGLFIWGVLQFIEKTKHFVDFDELLEKARASTAAARRRYGDFPSFEETEKNKNDNFYTHSSSTSDEEWRSHKSGSSEIGLGLDGVCYGSSGLAIAETGGCIG